MDSFTPILLAHRRQLVRIWLLFALVSLAVYIYLNYGAGEYIGMAVDLVLAVLVLLALPWVGRIHNFLGISILVAFSFSLLVISSGFRGYIEGYFWAACAPVVIFILSGRRVGGVLTALVISAMIVSLALKPHPVIHLRAPITILGSFTSLIIVVIMYERLRSSYEAELRRLSLKDPLTGAWNRRKYEEAVAEEILRSRRYRHPLSLITFDVDHFKQINDSYGHDAGDALLQAIVQICREVTRGTDLVIRAGGDEFLLLLPETSAELGSEGLATAGGAVIVADRVRAGVAALRFESGMRATVSLGVAELHGEEDAAALQKRADGALYEAKERGRNCYHIAPEGVPAHVFVPSRS